MLWATEFLKDLNFLGENNLENLKNLKIKLLHPLLMEFLV